MQKCNDIIKIALGPGCFVSNLSCMPTPSAHCLICKVMSQTEPQDLLRTSAAGRVQKGLHAEHIPLGWVSICSNAVG